MMTVLVATLAALVVGITLGLLGGGGTILTVPLLVYVLGVSPKAAIATSLVVVGATATASLLVHAREGHVRWRTGLRFGAAGMVGAYAGGAFAGHLPGRVLLVALAALMLATAIAMLRGRRSDRAPRERAWPEIVLMGFIVGAAAGLVGAGGGFLIVPALTFFAGLSVRDAVGTSLLVIALQSSAGFVGYAGHVEIDASLAAAMSGAAIVGSVIGARLARRLPPVTLRRAFAVFVLGTAMAIVVAEILGSTRVA